MQSKTMKRKLAIWVCPQNARHFLVSDKGEIRALPFNDGYHKDFGPRKPKIHQRADGQCFFSVGRKKGTKTAIITRLHRVIAECFCHNPDAATHKTVDHINGDRGDNAAENLRWATQRTQARAFRKKNLGKSSKYRGVTFCCRKKLWKAQLEKNNKHINGGYFEKEVDAAKAYNRLAVEQGFLPEALNNA